MKNIIIEPKLNSYVNPCIFPKNVARRFLLDCEKISYNFIKKSGRTICAFIFIYKQSFYLPAKLLPNLYNFDIILLSL
jgi:hypothetical protein